MKKIIQLLLTCIFILSFTFSHAQEDWGANKHIANNSEKCVISVAENGWIYVLHHFGSSFTSAENGWQLYVSKDEGWTFDLEIEHSYSTEDFYLVDVDMVSSGDDPSNINIFIGELRNTGSSGQLDGTMTIRRYSPGQMELMYQSFHGNDKAFSISMACDYRSPGGDCTPFCISAAWSRENTTLQAEELIYVYSSDGGETGTFHDRSLYTFPGIHRVSLALGNAGEQWAGYLAVAFELNYDSQSDMGDIGILIQRCSSGTQDWTDPVVVSHKFAYLNGTVSRPAVGFVQNQAYYFPGHPQVPFVVAMEEHSDASNSDLVIARFDDSFSSNGVQIFAPTMDQIVITYPFGVFSPEKEKNPHLMYDKGFGNFLLTYSTKDTEELIYAGINVDNIFTDDWWVMGNYRSNTGNLPDNPTPRVDIDLSKGKAVFAWRDNYVGFASPAKSYVDTEWWIVDIDENTNLMEASIYPNPTQGMISIELSEIYANFSLKVFDITGRIIQTEEFANTEKAEFYLNAKPGIYFVEITDNLHKRASFKVVKN